MSKVKKKHRTIPPPQGRLLFKYHEIESLNLSPILLLDQMIRHYLRHADGSDEEAKNFQFLLETKLTYIESELESLRITEPLAIPSDYYDQNKNSSSADEDTVLEPKPLLYGIVQDLRSRDSTKKEQVEKYRTLLIDLIRERLDFLEYLQVVNNIKLNKELESSNADNTEEEAGNVSDTSTVIEHPKSLPTPSTISRRTTRSSRLFPSSTNLSLMESKLSDLQDEINLKNKELEELNLLIIQRKEDLIDTSLTTIHHNSASEDANTSDQSLYSIQSEDANSDNEADKQDSSQTEETLSLPLQPSTVKRKLKELAQQTICTTTKDTDPYSRGRRQLENDFVRYGRKTWNDKDVKMFLRICKGYQKQSFSLKDTVEQEKFPDMRIILTPTLQIKFLSQSLLKDLESYKENITAELERLKNSKSKNLPFQLIHENFHNSCQLKIGDLLKTSRELENQLKNTQLTLQDSRMESLKNDLLTDMNQQFSKQLNKIKTLLSKSPTLSTAEKSKETFNSLQPSALSQTNKQKLVFIPNSIEDYPELEKSVLNCIKDKEVRPLIRSMKQTKNNNIEVITTKEDATILKNKLAPKTEVLYKVLDPDKRRRQIILLGVSHDITLDDLKEELKFRKVFINDDFEINKNLISKDKSHKNWVIETSILNYRELIKRGFINIYFNRIRIEHYVRVTRCTNCQALNDHTTHNCKYQTNCGKCAQNHRTADCDNSVMSCINCQRDKRNDLQHAAFSPLCPVYQAERAEALKTYYNYLQQPKKETNLSFNTYYTRTDDLPQRTHNRNSSRSYSQLTISQKKTISSSRKQVYLNSQYKNQRKYKEAMPPLCR